MRNVSPTDPMTRPCICRDLSIPCVRSATTCRLLMKNSPRSHSRERGSHSKPIQLGTSFWMLFRPVGGLHISTVLGSERNDHGIKDARPGCRSEWNDTSQLCQ